MWTDYSVRNLCVILSSWKYFKDGEGKDVSVYAMKACSGVELQLRSFLTPTQCNIEVKDQICYPAALHVGKETSVPIEKEADVQGGRSWGGGEWCGRHGQQSRNGGKFVAEMNILSEKIDF